MSEFLRNLAARSLGSSETIRPRVPSRFEPIRSEDGLLAARTPPGEESLEDNPAAEGAEADEAWAAREPVEKLVRAARPADLSPPRPSPSPLSAEAVPEPLPTQPAARSTARAKSPPMPPAPSEPVLQAKRIPESETAGSSTPARRTVAGTVTQRAQNAGNVPVLEPTGAETGHAVESAIAQGPETNEGAIQSRTEQEARTGRRTRSAPGLRPSRPGSGLIVSATVKTPSLLEQMNERPARASFIPSTRSETTPRMFSSQAIEPAGSDEAPIGQSQPKHSPPRRAMSMSVEPARTGEVLQDGSRRESGAETEDASGRPWSGNSLAVKPDLRRGLSIRPAPTQETATLATGAELAAADARPAAANLPAPQTSANGAPEPEIRVTIGRVEVRAVFPEQPVKRSAPPRFRPSVTLDDYLSRGSGAKR